MIKPTAIVAGALANKYGQGGEAWVRLSWILGLKELGFDVLFVEEADGPLSSEALGYFQSVTDNFGLSASAALIRPGGEVLAGIPRASVLHAAKKAELLVNISGNLTCTAIRERVRSRVYLDIDPGFTQFWHASGLAGARLEQHDFYFTIGENIGSPTCAIPTRGIQWRPTRPPVVLAHWPLVAACPSESQLAGNRIRLTTVANWRGAFGGVELGGKTYGQKVHEFRKVIGLPRRSQPDYEIALRIHPGDKKDLDALLENGWHIVDPKTTAGTPNAFQEYVQRSGAEFSVAQGVYVGTNSGWFSDRTVRYLASGKPALVQETGFSRHIPSGEGLLAFTTIEEAIEGAERIRTGTTTGTVVPPGSLRRSISIRGRSLETFWSK